MGRRTIPDKEYFAEYRKTEKYKQYRVVNAETIRKYKKEYRQANAEKVAEYNKKYLADYVKDNDERLKEYRKKRYLEKKDEIRLKQKEYYIKNQDKIKEKVSVYVRENRAKVNVRAKEYGKSRRKTDSLFKLVGNLRSRLYNCFKRMGYWKNSPTELILGAPFDVVRSHIETKFTHGMSWGNYGEWHVDHKTPLASAKTETELLLLCHYTNLQPLWKIDNLKKWAKLTA